MAKSDFPPAADQEIVVRRSRNIRVVARAGRDDLAPNAPFDTSWRRLHHAFGTGRTPMPQAMRRIAWTVAAAAATLVAVGAFIPFDATVPAQGVIVPAAPPITTAAPESSLLREIAVHEGQFVHAGAILARLDPNVTASDEHALAAQVGNLKTQVARLQAEAQGSDFTSVPGAALSIQQAATFAHDEADFQLKLEDYKQRSDELRASLARDEADIEAFRGRLAGAQDVENMHKLLESKGYDSHLNTIDATASRLEMARALTNAEQNAQAAQHDLAALQAENAAYVSGRKADIGLQLSDAMQKLNSATVALAQAALHRAPVVLRTAHDGIVQSIANVQPGSVVQAGETFITLVPTDTPLEVDVDIPALDNGLVHRGDRAEIDVRAFGSAHYDLAKGTVLSLTPILARTYQRNSADAGWASAPQLRARISIGRTNLPPDFLMTPGMPATADIGVGRRTVLAYLLGRPPHG